MGTKKPKTTVNVDAVRRDWKKLAKEAAKPAPANQRHVELPAGAVKRESPLEQEMGSRKYREMIHDHNKKNTHILDRLPFTFPKKRIVRSHLDVLISCPQCEYTTVGTENSVGFVCPKCKQYVSAKNVEAENRGYDPSLKVGIHGTSTDKLRLREEKRRKK